MLHLVALILAVLLLLGPDVPVSAQDQGNHPLAPPAPTYQVAVQSICTNAILLFYVKYYYRDNSTDSSGILEAPPPSSCVHMGREAVPASWLVGAPPDAASVVTVPYCIGWPGAVIPGGSALGPNTSFANFLYSVQLDNGRSLRYGGEGEQYFNLTGQPCQPDEPNCLAWTSAEGPGVVQLGCPSDAVVPPLPAPSLPPAASPPSNASVYPIILTNRCPGSTAVVAIRWFYGVDAVPPTEGTPACRHRGQGADGARYCVGYWLGLPMDSWGNPINTTVSSYYYTAYAAENPNRYWGNFAFYDFTGKPCAGFSEPGCLEWARVESPPDPTKAKGASLTCDVSADVAPPPVDEYGYSMPPPGLGLNSSVAGGPASPVGQPPGTSSGTDGSGGDGSAGVIAGAVVGAAAAIIAAAGLLLWYRKKRRRQEVLDRQSGGGPGFQGLDDAGEPPLLVAVHGSKSPGVPTEASRLLQEDPLVSYLHTRLCSKQLAVADAIATSSLASSGSSGSASGPSGLSSSGSGSGGSAGLQSLISSGQLAGLFSSTAVQFAELEFVRRIGEGSYGRVYLALWREDYVAVKILLGGGVDAAASQDWEQVLALDDVLLARLREETRIMLALRHTNVLQCFGVSTFPPAIVSEYCARGSLTDVLRAARAGEEELPWRRRLQMAIGAARGMLVLHSSTPPIVHRDLKSPNLLVDLHWTVKVSDFNLSRIMEDAAHSQSSQTAMNPRWLAPEVMRGRPGTPAADVFSFGVIMWELLTWQLPWATEGSNAWQIVGAVMSGGRLPIPPREQLPGADTLRFDGLDDYIALLKSCWAQEQEARPTFRQVARELRDLLEALDGGITSGGATPGLASAGNSGNPLPVA